MSSQDIKQIMVGGHLVGIIGLQEALEQIAKVYSADMDDERLKGELLEVLKRKNYIPARAEEEYARAFLREFKKFMNMPYEEDTAQGLDVKILGQGCARCDALVEQVMRIMGQTGIVGNVEHIKDLKEIAKYGAMGSPALVINGEVKSVGTVPPEAKIRKWIEEAYNSSGP